MKSRLILCFFLFAWSMHLHAQLDSVLSNIEFEMDFRFRAEQDWDSRKSDGTYREDRSRLRYRFRIGATYKKAWYSFGLRVRTGDPNKQQDPQLTLGKGLKEFGTLPMGFEKVFFQIEQNNYRLWMGKNSYPFEKNNELFWSDNIFPEGVMLERSFHLNFGFIDKAKLTGGHFILSSNDGSFTQDAYFQGFQTSVSTRNKRVNIFPSIYIFRNIPNIPDGEHTFLLNYTIAHWGMKAIFLKSRALAIDFDFYQNLEKYDNTNISSDLNNQKTGYTIGIQYGNLTSKNEWQFKVTYAYLERFANLDYMAQNDWARWDYSSNNSPDGRLSNMRGAEFVVKYALTKKIFLVSKYYIVEQIIPYGTAKETGQRIRFDIDVKF
ncbi:MAG: putative porin [Bacteroidota bacterium]